MEIKVSGSTRIRKDSLFTFLLKTEANNLILGCQEIHFFIELRNYL